MKEYIWQILRSISEYKRIISPDCLKRKYGFFGESIVVGFDGETIALAGNQEELILAEVNLGGAAIKRNQRPYTSLRRTDLYE